MSEKILIPLLISNTGLCWKDKMKRRQSDSDIIESELEGRELCEFCRTCWAAGGSLGAYCSDRCACTTQQMSVG